MMLFWLLKKSLHHDRGHKALTVSIIYKVSLKKHSPGIFLCELSPLALKQSNCSYNAEEWVLPFLWILLIYMN